MPVYEVGFILIRCHIQKKIEMAGGVEVIPLPSAGSSGYIHTARRLLESAGFSLSRKSIEAALADYKDTEHAVCLKVPNIEATSFQNAIESAEGYSAALLGALAVISANPVIPLCAFATAPGDVGIKWFIPQDRKILHATNVAGYLDALPAIAQEAGASPKLRLLLRLYRASLRELDVDYQLLFQLILFEEASDDEEGNLGQRVRAFAEKKGFSGDLAGIAQECGLTLPAGKDMIDVIVKLRNSATHDGKIDADSLQAYGGDWAVPLLADKAKLHKAVGEAIRYMFCALVGHTRDAKATLVTGSLELKFD